MLVNFSRIKNYTRPKDSCSFVVFKNLLVLTNNMLHSKTCCYPYLISSHICMILYRYSKEKFCLRNSWRVKEKKASFFISGNSCSHSTYCFLLTFFFVVHFPSLVLGSLSQNSSLGGRENLMKQMIARF